MLTDILGSVYERFLGKKIQLTSKNRCEVVFKPEVAKAGGVYYTPQYIVKYIIQKTLGEQLKTKTLKTIKDYSIVDPACGIKKSHLLKYYQGKMDIWYFFACFGVDILKQNGMLGLIVPNNWVTNTGASILRNKVLAESTIQNIIDFGPYLIFDNASIHTMIFITAKYKQSVYSFDYRKIETSKPNFQLVQKILEKEIEEGLIYLSSQIIPTELKNKVLLFNNNKTEMILYKIKTKANFVLDKNTEVAQGIVAPQDCLNGNGGKKLDYSVPKGTGIFIVSEKERNAIKPNKLESLLFKPYFTTEQLG